MEIEFGVTKLPKYDVPEGYTSWEYLNKLCWDGFAERYPDDTGKLRDQLTYELSIIQKMGYVDYFLIVWDFIKYSRDHGIAVGPCFIAIFVPKYAPAIMLRPIIIP